MSLRVTNVSALQAIPTSGYDPTIVQTAYVTSVGDWFSFSAGTSMTPASSVVVNSSDGLGQWSRMGVTNQTFISAAYGNVTAADATLANVSVTGLPSFTTRGWVRPMGEYILQPNTGFPSDGKVLISATDGRQWVFSTRPYSTAAVAQNSGSVAGRLMQDVLIDWSQLSGVSSYAPPAWTVGAYRSLTLKIKGTSGSATGFGVTLTGLGATYKELGIYNEGNAPGTIAGIGSNTVWSVGMGALPWRIRGDLEIDTGGARQGSLTTANASGTAANRFLSYRLEFLNDDTTSDVTGIAVSFTGGTIDVGSAELWGVPYIPAPTTTLLQMGDSITEGGPSGGFRRKIITELSQFMPVGALTTDPPLAPFPSNRIKHEGHGGQSSSYFVTNIAAIWAANPAPFVTFLIGANDAIAGVAPSITAANIATVVDYIHAQAPNTFIWVGLVTNATSAQTAWNALLDQQRPLVTTLCASRPWTKAVTLPHLTDGQLDGSVHPVNAAAYDVVADAWISAMRPA